MAALGLENDYVNNILSLMKIKQFKGVYPVDQFNLENLAKNCCIIINTDASDGRGEHFIVIIKNSNNKFSYYDPAALPLIAYQDAYKYLKNYQIKLINKRAVQSPTSVFCGFFCVHFIAKTYLKPKKLQKFNRVNLKTNDLIVQKNIVKMFKNKALFLS